MRKLVTIRQVDNIKPITGADAIEAAVFGGWEVVVKKGEFSIGDYALFFEIDSILPSDNPMFDFLNDRGSKDLPNENGDIVNGFRLRTVKLRGQVSQGLALPLPNEIVISDVPGTVEIWDESSMFERIDINEDFSFHFGVTKYEKPIPAALAGQIRGNYPGWLPKTDQERVQNLYGKIPEGVYQIEEKLEGSSMTIYWDGETVGVTSRNVDLKIEQEGNAYVDEAKETGLLEILPTIQGPIAIRGELIGNGVQGNIYKMRGTEFRVFDIYSEGRYLNPSERAEVIAYLRNLGAKFFEVPILGEIEFKAQMEDELIEMADGTSQLYDTLREGLVFKGNGFSFKSVSKKYLEQEK